MAGVCGVALGVVIWVVLDIALNTAFDLGRVFFWGTALDSHRTTANILFGAIAMWPAWRAGSA
jgi:hypothetical protein